MYFISEVESWFVRFEQKLLATWWYLFIYLSSTSTRR